jgi:hypothetical protein
MPVTALLKRSLVRLGAYRFAWDRSLLDPALFVIMFGGVTALSQWIFE